jgi:phosphate transport system substrate-binding protein
MKKWLSWTLVLALALSTMLFTGCQSEVTPDNSAGGTSQTEDSKAEENSQDESKLTGTLSLTGSTSMAEVCNALGEAFMKKYPGTTVQKGGTGSGEAAPAVLAGTAQIGDLSRAIKEDENPDQFTAVTIALDGIGVVVNKDNPVAALSKEEIAKIFTGEITNWKELGGNDQAITVVGREESSGTRDGFESIFSVKDECKYAVVQQETGMVVSKVGSDASAIGYVSLASVDETKGVKALEVDGVKATEENVANGTYVVQRPFVQIYLKGSTDPLVKAWFEFLASEEGQQIIESKKLVTQEINPA